MEKFIISNQKGMKAVTTDYGATLVSVIVKDAKGNDKDVVLGYDNIEDYKTGGCYFGATVGRNANRIANAQITIDGVVYHLEQNDSENNLHSGKNGVSNKEWKVAQKEDNKITYEIVSKDLEQDFPGNCTIKVTYEVTEDNELKIIYHAVSDKKTVINMTNHSYFNLAGHESGDILNQELQLNASHFTPVIDAKSIPTGELAPVEGTPFDFRTAKTIGKDINAQNDQLTYGHGYDHNYAIDKTGDGIEKIASAYCKETGICMDVLTDLPGVQLYTANFVNGQKGKDGAVYNQRSAFCLETQYFPNAVNDSNFATPVFDAGTAYESTTIYAFSVK